MRSSWTRPIRAPNACGNQLSAILTIIARTLALPLSLSLSVSLLSLSLTQCATVRILCRITVRSMGTGTVQVLRKSSSKRGRPLTFARCSSSVNGGCLSGAAANCKLQRAIGSIIRPSTGAMRIGLAPSVPGTNPTLVQHTHTHTTRRIQMSRSCVLWLDCIPCRCSRKGYIGLIGENKKGMYACIYNRLQGMC